MTTPADFKGARTKVARARELIAEMRQRVANFKGMTLESRAVPEGMGLFIEFGQPLPVLETVLGDAVHNLRAALDHTAVNVVRLNDGNPKGVHFPFAESADGLLEQIKNQKFSRASQEAIDLLLSIKPYRGGNEALRSLHDLDLLDKHNDLIPTFQGAVQQVPLTWGMNNVMTGSTFPAVVHHVPVILFEKRTQPFPPIPMSLAVRFPIKSVFGRQEIVPVLTHLAKNVTSIIDAFAALYGR